VIPIWSEAEAIARSIEDEDNRAKILLDVANILISFAAYDRTLHLVQRSWLQADTRSYAIQLLQLANGLFNLKDHLGRELSEAFFWVANFLRV
jgi:hypothetical protein